MLVVERISLFTSSCFVGDGDGDDDDDARDREDTADGEWWCRSGLPTTENGAATWLMEDGDLGESVR